MLSRHRAVRKDTHERRPCCRENYETLLCLTATARTNFWRSDTTRHKPKLLEIASRCAHHCMCPMFHCMCPGRRDQKRHTQSALVRCASLHVSRFSRWQRRGQKSHTWAHCHLCHAGASGICEASATGQHPPGPPAAVAFQCESNQAENGNPHQKASNTHGAAIHPPCASPGATHCGPARLVRCFRRASHMAGLSPRSCGSRLASSGGWRVLLWHLRVDTRLRAYRAQTSAVQDPRHAISLARWLQAIAYSTWRAGDAVRKDTQSEQARLSGNRSPTHEMANRDYHMQLTTHFLLIHPLLLTAKICLLQLRACIRRCDPYHVPSQTDLINHCSNLPSFETKTNNKMGSVKEARCELDPWNDNYPKTWSLKQ